MSDALEGAVAPSISADEATFASLPLTLAHRIFLALPVDARGRASCVCRAWRDVLADPSLWTQLDLSRNCGVALAHRDSEALNRLVSGAAARARGLLYRLDVSGAVRLHVAWLSDALDANAGSLRELTLHDFYDSNFDLARAAEILTDHAPLLRVVKATDVCCTSRDARRVMRTRQPFKTLQLCRTLEVHFSHDGPLAGMNHFGPLVSALADVSLQPALSRVEILNVDTAHHGLMNALVDAALARRLRGLGLRQCSPPAAAPLARLLSNGLLEHLSIMWTSGVNGTPLFDEAGAALVADALRMKTTLTSLEVFGAGFLLNIRAACTLLSALVGHPCLRLLAVAHSDYNADVGALAAAVATLIGADAPTLHILNCFSNRLGDAGAASIVEALSRNCHLRTLNIGDNGVSDAFGRELDTLLADHPSLRELEWGNFGHRDYTSFWYTHD